MTFSYQAPAIMLNVSRAPGLNGPMSVEKQHEVDQSARLLRLLNNTAAMDCLKPAPMIQKFRREMKHVRSLDYYNLMLRCSRVKFVVY